jgi:hypothetical protein
MNTGTILKWGVILVIAYFAWNWISNQISSAQQVQAPPNPNMWAAPLVLPGPVYGWYPPRNWGPWAPPPWPGRRRPGGPIPYQPQWTPNGPYA